MHTLKEIAQLVNGKVIGDEHYKITSPAKIEDAQAFNISFLANEKYLPFIETTNAGAIILSQNSYKKIKKSIVPDVRGMGARDAVFLLENMGLKVKLDGVGKVQRQSIPPGAGTHGQNIVIYLN